MIKWAVMKVAIVGGGVGGLTAAIALARKGIECKVYEQAPSITAPGASLQLGPNALRLMDELGLLPRLRARSALASRARPRSLARRNPRPSNPPRSVAG